MRRNGVGRKYLSSFWQCNSQHLTVATSPSPSLNLSGISHLYCSTPYSPVKVQKTGLMLSLTVDVTSTRCNFCCGYNSTSLMQTSILLEALSCSPATIQVPCHAAPATIRCPKNSKDIDWSGPLTGCDA